MKPADAVHRLMLLRHAKATVVASGKGQGGAELERLAGITVPVFLLPMGTVGVSMILLGALVLWRERRRRPSRQPGVLR